MKTSVFGFGASGMNWTQAIDYVAALGAAGIEPYPMAELQTPSLPAARRVGDYAREKGLALPCFSTAARMTGEGAQGEIERLCGYADVCAEMGVAYLHHTLIPKLEPESMQRDIDAGHVCARALTGTALRRENHLAWHRSKFLTPAAEDFLNLCREVEVIEQQPS